MRLLLASLLMVLIFGASPARASLTFPEQEPARAIAVKLTEQARQWWAKQGVTGCARITVFEAPKLNAGDGIEAWGRAGECTSWLTTDLVGALIEAHTDVVDTLRACWAVYHEAGHALGLPHSNHGVMAGAQAGQTAWPQEPYPFAWMPWACAGWSRGAIVAAARKAGEWPEEIREHRRDLKRALRHRTR